MITRINKVSNCLSYLVGTKNILFSFKAEEKYNSYVRLWNYENQFHYRKDFDFEITNYMEVGSKYFVTDDEHNCYVSNNQDLSGLKFYTKDFYVNLSNAAIIDDSCYAVGYNYYSESGSKKWNKIISLGNNKEIYKSDNQLYILNNLIIEKDLNKNENRPSFISCMNLKDQKLLWNYDLMQQGYYSSFKIKAIDDRYLLIYTNLFSSFFELKTGKLLWQSEDFLLGYSKSNFNGDKLIAFSRGYVEFDLNTGKRKIERNIRDKYPEFRSGTPAFWQSGDLIITVETKTNKIYFYDIDQDEMIYIYEEKEAKPYLSAKPIFYHDRHLFVKDFNDTLFVYELEEGLANKLEGNKTLT